MVVRYVRISVCIEICGVISSRRSEVGSMKFRVSKCVWAQVCLRAWVKLSRWENPQELHKKRKQGNYKELITTENKDLDGLSIMHIFPGTKSSWLAINDVVAGLEVCLSARVFACVSDLWILERCVLGSVGVGRRTPVEDHVAVESGGEPLVGGHRIGEWWHCSGRSLIRGNKELNHLTK